MNNRLILWGMLLMSLPLRAQNDIQLSMQNFSRVNSNPAATGNSEDINVFLLSRKQWIGFAGAPSTHVFNAHNFFPSINSGLGLSLVYDKVGPEESFNAKVAYAYHIWITDKSFLSMGLAAGALNKNYNGAEAIPEDPQDPGLMYDRISKLSPDFDFGLEFNTRRLTAGASVTHLTSAKSDVSNVLPVQHYYVYAYYKQPLPYNLQIVPGLSLNKSAWVELLEMSVTVFYCNQLFVGLTYRNNEWFTDNESVIIMAGLNITHYLRLGYAYDYNAGALKNYSGGTHEIMLHWKIRKYNPHPRKTPRFFE